MLCPRLREKYQSLLAAQHLPHHSSGALSGPASHMPGAVAPTRAGEHAFRCIIAPTPAVSECQVPSAPPSMLAAKPLLATPCHNSLAMFRNTMARNVDAIE